MKRITFLIIITCIGFVPIAHAQNHGEVGAFVEYFKLNQTGSNFAGLGARAAINAARHVQVEAEMSYDFNQVFTEGFTDTGTGTITTLGSNIKVLRFDPRPASFSTFTSSVDNLRTNNVSAALYPGGGVEAFLGPIGLRVEVGDEIIFANEAHHNWKVSFGPQIRF